MSVASISVTRTAIGLPTDSPTFFPRSLSRSQETPSTEEAAERREQRAASREQHHVQKYPAFGTQIYGIETDEGVRACDSNGKPLSAAVAVSYVEKAFGDKLEDARTAMRALAEVGMKFGWTQSWSFSLTIYLYLTVNPARRTRQESLPLVRKGAFTRSFFLQYSF